MKQAMMPCRAATPRTARLNITASSTARSASARCSRVISNCPGAYSDMSVRTGTPSARAAVHSSSSNGDMSSRRPSP